MIQREGKKKGGKEEDRKKVSERLSIRLECQGGGSEKGEVTSLKPREKNIHFSRMKVRGWRMEQGKKTGKERGKVGRRLGLD